MPSAQSTNQQASFQPNERIEKIKDLMGSGQSKVWSMNDQNVSITTTTSGYDIRCAGMASKGNNRYLLFELNAQGDIVLSEARVAVGCLIEKVGSPPEQDLDAVLATLR